MEHYHTFKRLPTIYNKARLTGFGTGFKSRLTGFENLWPSYPWILVPHGLPRILQVHFSIRPCLYKLHLVAETIPLVAFQNIIIRYRQVVRPHRLPCILKVYLSIRLLHLRGRDTQAGSMGTSNPDIQIMGPPSKIGNKVTDHSCGYIEFASSSSLPPCRHTSAMVIIGWPQAPTVLH